MNQTLSRVNDPANSSLAADAIERDGTLGRMYRIALDLITAHPGQTANELEKIGGYRDGQIRKRLKALLDQGLITRGASRESTVTGKMNATYYLA